MGLRLQIKLVTNLKAEVKVHFNVKNKLLIV